MAIKIIDKTIIIKIGKILSTINLDNKHSYTISNDDMDTIKNLKQTNSKKY